MAIRFANKDGYGLVLRLSKCHGVDVRNFDCEAISCFPEEKEILFFGGETILQLKEIKQIVGGKWKPYWKYMGPLNIIRRMISGRPIKGDITKKIKLKRIVRDILRFRHCGGQNMECPEYIGDLAVFQSSIPEIRLNYTELLRAYRLFHCIFVTASSDTLDTSNIAVLFSHADCITFALPHNYVLDDSECNGLVDDLVAITAMSLFVIVQFEWPSYIPMSMKWNFSQHPRVNRLRECDVSIEFSSRSMIFEVQDGGEFVKAESAKNQAVRMIESLSRDEVSVQVKSAKMNTKHNATKKSAALMKNKNDGQRDDYKFSKLDNKNNLRVFAEKNLFVADMALQQFFEVNKLQIEISRDMYQGQVPWLWNGGFANDEALLYLVTIQRLQCCDYLIHVIDAYSRARISHFQRYGSGSNLTIDSWCTNQAHFRRLKGVKIDLCGQRVQADVLVKRYVFERVLIDGLQIVLKL